MRAIHTFANQHNLILKVFKGNLFVETQDWAIAEWDETYLLYSTFNRGVHAQLTRLGAQRLPYRFGGEVPGFHCLIPAKMLVANAHLVKL